MEPKDGLRRDSTINTATTAASKSSFFARSLIRRDALKSEPQRDAPKGPLGLTTLHEPDADVVIDLIFVHGLNGDAQHTWSKNRDPALFWPKAWLPFDRGFRDVRIHTFGYASAIFKAGGVLNIPDFARSLLGAIQDAPSKPSDNMPPLVLVGHSMGGLVIKKAYILGRQIAEFQPLVTRIKAIFFLATPHQGADIAVTLSKILHVVSPKSHPPFVGDLFPQSPILQSINDEFPRLCDSAESLQLFSFFETRPMNYGVGKGLIVDKHCAVMNYPRERRTYLDADHRDVARYATPEDPSYVTIRNALAALIDAQRRTNSKVVEDIGQERRDALFKFLGSPEIPEDDILMQDSKRLHGSGQWFLQKETFEKWQDAYSSKLLWLHGRPGAGKSFLAGKVVNYLRQQGRDCCSFFFASGDNSKGTINAFLRSMAYQMAVLHPEIHSTIMELSLKKNTALDEVNHNQLWRQLYLSGGILKVKLDRGQYWVIDALDECRDSHEILSFLVKAQELWPLCILITSREPFEPSMTHRTEVLTDTMSDEDNNKDIALFLRTNLDFLPAPTVEAREQMAEQLFDRAKGCFLWVNLMLKELRQVHTAAETKQVLASNPSDMDELYLKIVDDMSRARFGKDLAKAILIWTTCSFRPLFKDELHAAIQLDINDIVDDIEKSVAFCCGNLAFVDNRARVQLIHTTARDFLLNKELNSEFAVDNTEGHTRLALACIQCLLKNAKRPPARGQVPEKSALVNYASEYLFQHLVHVRSTNDVVLQMVAEFFASSSLLNWLEYIAANSDLRKVYQAGTTVSHLLKRRAQHTPNVGHLQKDMQKLEIWGTDLLNLVSKFSHRMRHAPSAIHQLIPPFCPPESMIRKQFCLPNRGLSVHGTSGRTWDECLTTITYEKGTKPMSMDTGRNVFALGMNNGSIIVYDDTVFQEVQILNHNEPVWLLKFDDAARYLASSSAKSIRIWDMETWTEVYRFDISSLPLALSFIENDVLLVATKKNEIMYFDLYAGDMRDDPINWTRDFDKSGEGPALHLRQPMMADYSPHQHLLAIIYRGEDILLWDTEQDHIHDMYEKETGSRSNGSLKLADGATSVRSLTFSSAPDTYLLAATYSDGDLIVYNTWTRGCTENVNRRECAVASILSRWTDLGRRGYKGGHPLVRLRKPAVSVPRVYC